MKRTNLSNLDLMLEKEIDLVKMHYSKKDYQLVFDHLERLHILGQKSVFWHTISHFWMLKTAIKCRDWNEVFGQLLRLPLGIIGSGIGVVPIGNTGRSSVGIFKKMKIPDDLKTYLD